MHEKEILFSGKIVAMPGPGCSHPVELNLKLDDRTKSPVDPGWSGTRASKNSPSG